MTALTYANAVTSDRIKMIEGALEKVLDRQGMEIVPGHELGEKAVMVVDGIYSDFGIRHSLYTIACELEALLP